MKNRRVMLLTACMCSVVFLSGCSADALMDKMMGNTTTAASGTSTIDISKDDGDAVRVDSSLEKPVFSVNPVESLEVEAGSTNGKLTCEASVSGEGTVTYQWYKNNVNSNGGGTLIDGATDTTYVPDTTTEGTDYYYVVATNTVDKTVSMATSTVAQVKVDPAGQWIQDDTGWWYKNSDGSYPTSVWKNIGGYWYAFDESGYMRTGWFQDGDFWYYLADSGQMQTGWITVDGKEYYLAENGQMAHDTTVDGKELGSDGATIS